jgi:hypothetical protein
MTAKENLQLAAAIIVRSVPDIRCLAGLLENAGQMRLAAEIHRQMETPTVSITGQAHCDPAMWREGRVR